MINHIGDQPQIAGPGPGIAAHHDRVIDGGMAAQHGLDLAELDPEAADLHLMIDTAEMVKSPVGAPAPKVAGAVESRIGLR